jgi:putative membrane protein
MQRSRLSATLFAAHLALIAFSTVAMLTILNRSPGAWLMQEPNATVMRLAWRFSGPLYVTLGALAMLAFLAPRLGARRTTLVFLAGAGIALAAELAGTTTGLPFGEYHYSTLLGPRILGLVPIPIPISWFYMLVGCVTIVARLAPASDDAASRWRWAALAAAVLVAWDFAMDPAMVHTGHWSWGSGQQFHAAGVPSWIADFFTRDRFYGMPLSNWFGWYLTGLAIARVMLAIAPPSVVRSQVATSRFPILLYLANGVMPVALCLRDGLWWGAALGAIAMMLLAGLAIAPRLSILTSPALPAPR